MHVNCIPCFRFTGKKKKVDETQYYNILSPPGKPSESPSQHHALLPMISTLLSKEQLRWKGVCPGIDDQQRYSETAFYQ